MNFELVGKNGWSECRHDFAKVLNEVMVPNFAKFFNDDVTVVVTNHHRPHESYDLEKVKEDFGPFISADKEENRKKVFMVNYGWHGDGETMNIASYFDTFKVVNSDIPRYKKALAFEGEYAYQNKNGDTIATFLTTEEGYHVVWFLFDAFHMSCDGIHKILGDVLTRFSINCYDSALVLAKFAEVKVEGKEDPFAGKTFVSIKTKADSLVKKKEIVEKMLDSVDYRNLVKFLNIVYKLQANNSAAHVNETIVREWLRPWAENKYPYFVMFGEKLEITAPIELALDPKRDQAIIVGFFDDLKRKFPQYATTLALFSLNELFENTIKEVKSGLVDYAPHTKGAKLSKFFSSLFNDESFDVELSKFIQSRKLSSTIHISINPMDYLTSAINKHGWHSCHNMFDGSYGGGNVGYMSDPGTLIAFLCSDREYTYSPSGVKEDFVWNSKSWRQLIYGSPVENEFIFAREYPQNYNNNDIANMVRSMLEDCASNFCEIPNVWVKKNNGARGSGKGNIYEIIKGSSCYDDVPHQEHVLIKHKMNVHPETLIHTCGPQKCVVTGGSCEGTQRIFSSAALRDIRIVDSSSKKKASK